MPKSPCPSRSDIDYDLLMAEDGPTAIGPARNNDIAVAVPDIHLAGMSGIEVLERLINKNDYDKNVKEIMESLE
jgi:CheY-like chemotaxis protein